MHKGPDICALTSFPLTAKTSGDRIEYRKNNNEDTYADL